MGKLERLKRVIVQTILWSFRPMFRLNRLFFMRLQDRVLAGVGIKSEFQMWIGGVSPFSLHGYL